MAPDRGTAVYKASQIFWDKYKKLGTIKSVMVVSDPYEEVKFTETFDCRDRSSKLLPKGVAEKIAKDSGGEIILDTDPNSAYSLKRAKRRRKDLGEFVAPNVKLMYGKLYYRVITRSQKTVNGSIKQKRKYEDVLLNAKDLDTALDEIRERGLHVKSNRKAAFKTAKRSLVVLKKTIESQKIKKAIQKPAREVELNRKRLLTGGKVNASQVQKSAAVISPIGSVWGSSQLLKSDTGRGPFVTIKDHITTTGRIVLDTDDGRAVKH